MTETDICNMSLGYIGKGQIKSMEENQENARTCKLYYHQTRQETLRDFPWNFAVRVERLALVHETVSGYAYAYAWPETCVRICKLRGEESWPMTYEPYEVLNMDTATKLIACNLEEAYLVYIYDVTDPDLMDAAFIEGFARLLAAKISMALTGNPQQYQLQYQMYQTAVQKARIYDGQEGQKPTPYKSTYAEARRPY